MNGVQPLKNLCTARKKFKRIMNVQHYIHHLEIVSKRKVWEEKRHPLIELGLTRALKETNILKINSKLTIF